MRRSCQSRNLTLVGRLPTRLHANRRAGPVVLARRAVAAQPLTVTISSLALREIREEIEAHYDAIDLDSIETGGGLFAPAIRRSHRDVSVVMSRGIDNRSNCGANVMSVVFERPAAFVRADRSSAARFAPFAVVCVTCESATTVSTDASMSTAPFNDFAARTVTRNVAVQAPPATARILGGQDGDPRFRVVNVGAPRLEVAAADEPRAVSRLVLLLDQMLRRICR